MCSGCHWKHVHYGICALFASQNMCSIGYLLWLPLETCALWDMCSVYQSKHVQYGIFALVAIGNKCIMGYVLCLPVKTCAVSDICSGCHWKHVHYGIFAYLLLNVIRSFNIAVRIFFSICTLCLLENSSAIHFGYVSLPFWRSVLSMHMKDHM